MRPFRKIVSFWLQLLVWSLICVFKLDFGALTDWQKGSILIQEQPLPLFVLFFGLLMLGAAHLMKTTGHTAASLWGSVGLETSFAAPTKLGWEWLVLALLGTAIGLGIAESRQSYYFVQDDNYAEFLPGIVYGCREVFAGRFANWNPYQMLGMPLADLGTYALTYPPTYISYAIARFLLRDELRVIDVFCWIHLLSGAAAFYCLCRYLRLWTTLSAAAAVCFTLSGYSLIAGRSWYYMTPTAVWFPLLMLLAMNFKPEKSGPLWTVATGLSLGMFYHSGNVQMWLYGVGFFILIVCLRKIKEEWHWQDLMRVLPGFIIGVGLILPLLIPQWRATSGMVRSAAGEGIERGLFSLIFPNPFVNSPMVNKTGSDLSASGGQFYYAGTLFTMAWLFGLAALSTGNGGMKAFRANPMLTGSVIAFLSALGQQGGLWVLQTKLPLLSGFTHPEKFLPFLHLFSILIGALFVQGWCSRYANRQAISTAVLFVCIGLMFHHASLSTQAFYVYGDRPDSEISSSLVASIGNERFFPAAPQRSESAGFLPSLMLNVGTLVNVQSLDGHEPLWRSKSPFKDLQNSFVDSYVETLNTYGVTRIIFHSTLEKYVPSKNKSMHSMEDVGPEWNKKLHNLVLDKPILYSDDRVSVTKLSGSDPLARRESDKAELPLRIVGSDLVVSVPNSGEQEEIMVNYLWRPGITATIGNSPIETRPDKYQRILLTAPQNGGYITIRYEVGWLKVIALGLLVVLFGCALEAWLGQSKRFHLVT